MRAARGLLRTSTGLQRCARGGGRYPDTSGSPLRAVCFERLGLPAYRSSERWFRILPTIYD